MDKKYIIKGICDISINDKKAIFSNNMNGKWIKVPIECYEAIKYSIENSLSLNEVVGAFEDINDKIYFEKVIENLCYIGLTSEKNVIDTKVSFVNKVSFSITNKCNLNCDYCCADSNLKNKDILSTSDIKLAINNIMKLNPRVIVFTGGEPLTRSDFFDILEYTNTIFDGKIVLATNAILIKSNQIEKLINNIYGLEISLDGYDEDSCSEIRGNGVFNKVVNVIKLTKEKGFDNISLSMVVGKHNAKNVSNFYKLNEELGTKPLIRNFLSVGRGNDSALKYLDNKNTVEYTQLDSYDDINEIISNRCTAGNSQISINHEGDVFLCPVLEYDEFKMFNVFNLNDDIIEKIYNRKLQAFYNFDQLKPKNIDSCKSCSLNVFCTTCPAKMYILKHDKKLFDYNCSYMKDCLMNKVWK